MTIQVIKRHGSFTTRISLALGFNPVLMKNNQPGGF